MDTCVILDLLQGREGFVDDALELFRAAAADQFSGFTTAKAVADIYCLYHRYSHSHKDSIRKIKSLLKIIGVLDTTADDIISAIESQTSDFEDAVMTATAIHSKMDCIITRNIKDYQNVPIAVYTPQQFLSVLGRHHGN